MKEVGDLYQAPQNSFIFMRPEGFSVIRVGWVVPKVSEVHSVLCTNICTKIRKPGSVISDYQNDFDDNFIVIHSHHCTIFPKILLVLSTIKKIEIFILNKKRIGAVCTSPIRILIAVILVVV